MRSEARKRNTIPCRERSIVVGARGDHDEPAAAVAAGRPAFVRQLHRLAFADSVNALGHDECARFHIRLDQNGIGIALNDLDRKTVANTIVDKPDISAIRSPLDRQRVDGCIFVAREAHGDTERHAGAQGFVAIGD